MELSAVLDQIVSLLRQRRRVSYRALKLQFALNDDAINAVKTQLIDTQQLAVDEQGTVLVWTGPSTPGPELTTEHAGAPLSYTPSHLAEKIFTARHGLAGEPKHVTVLLVDLKGTLDVLADRDPEEAGALLAPVFDRLLTAAHRFEGTVTQVQRHGLTALFGAPLAHEDHTVRACYAALAMREAMQRYSMEVRRAHGFEIQLRIGLNAGEVVVGTIDNDLHMDYTAIGPTLHLATRLQQLAPPGSIRLTAETLRLVEGLVQVTPLGPIPVPGLPAPVEVFELVGAGPTRRRLQAAAVHGLTRFVGRQHELEALRQALERATAGHGQVGALVGEPGVGKSRLVYEFVHSHRTQGWLVLESSAVSYGQATPYFPIIDLLSAYFQIEARDDGRRRREKVTGKLLTLDLALGPTLPAFLALLDVHIEDSQWQALDPPQRRQRTLDAIKSLLLRESQEQPVLLVCEDLHWIDTETQGLLDTLVESLPAARLLLLVNYRPEYQSPWISKAYATQLRLDPLPPVSAEALLQALLGEDGRLAPLTPLLIARTEGNPFFLEESVRTLVEMGVLRGARGAYHLAQPLDSLQVPTTVQAMLTARLDRLPPEARHLLQAAAVIGHEVPLPLLRAIAEGQEVALQRSLAHLRTAEFLDETSLFPEVEYTFKHALTHEVAYGSVLQERRRTLHAQIVDAIEQLAPDYLPEVASGAKDLPAGRQAPDQVDRLAHHAVRGEVWDKALRYCQQAGARAAERSALREAAAAFEQALAALAQLPECRDTLEQAIDLRLALRNVLFPLDEQARSFDHLRAAEALAERLGDAPRLGRVVRFLCIYFVVMGEHDHAMTAAQRALALATSGGAFDVEVVPLLTLGTTYLAVGDFRQALDVARRVMALLSDELLYARLGAALPAVASRGYVAGCLAELGHFVEGRSVGEDAVRIAQAVEQPYSLAVALIWVGLLCRRQGDLQTAIPRLERCLVLSQTANIPLFFPLTASILGAAYTLAGRTVEAIPLLDQTLKRLATGSRIFFHALVLVELSEALLLVGRVDEASALAERLLALSLPYTGRGYQTHAARLLGEVAIRRDPPDVDQAAAHYRQALALAEELGMCPLQAHCHRGLGTLYTRTGQREQARVALATAIKLYRAMDMTFWLPTTEAALAQLGA